MRLTLLKKLVMGQEIIKNPCPIKCEKMCQ